MTHELKCWPEFFGYVLAGIKKYELRLNDRGFQVSDMIFLREFDPVKGTYTGRTYWARITHILEGYQFGLEKGYVILSF